MLRAAAILMASHPSAHVVLCGRGVERGNGDFVALAPELIDEPRLHLLGLRSDIPRIDAALDIAVLSSVGGEAFPLAIGEAMASGVPCVVTDVGDAAVLVGDTGTVVPSSDPQRLATAIGDLLDRPLDVRRGLGAAARARVVANYELDHIVGRYEELYRELVGR